MKERVEAIEFFEDIIRNSDMPQKIYYDDKYAWIEKREEFVGYAIISDPVRLTTSVTYDYSEQEVTENTHTNLQDALSLFRNKVYSCSFDPKIFVEHVDTLYDSFAKRQKIICNISKVDGRITCDCVPTKKRSLLIPATFNIGESNNEFSVSINLNSLYLVLRYIFFNKSEVYLSCVPEGIVIGCGSEATKFFIYKKSQDDYDKKSS